MNIVKLYRIVLLAGSLLLIGVLFISPVHAQQRALEWHPFEEALELAKVQEKPVFVDVWAPWCGWCKKLQKEVYPELSEELSREFIFTRLNRDDNATRESFRNNLMSPLRIAQKLNVQSVPAIVLLSTEGAYLFHISGFVETDQLESVLKYMKVNNMTVSVH